MLARSAAAASIALLTSLFAAACSGGSAAPGGPSGPTGPFTQSIAYASAFGGIGASPAPQPTPLVMYDQQFLDPMASQFLVALQISPAAHPSITWSSSNTAVAALSQQISNGTTPPPTAPAGETFITIGSSYGTSLITAAAGSPVSANTSFTAYHYPSLSFGCRFRFEPAWAFDPDRSTAMHNWSNWTAADLYDTTPGGSLGALDPCMNSPLATGSTEQWHTPYGGVLLGAMTLQQFAAVSASQWSNSGTVFTPPANTAVILFKTYEGRIVKAYLPIGPYEVSDTSGNFPY